MGMAEHRDLQAANAVAEMAKLGRFETEFLLFGTAVQEADEKVYYYATANKEKLVNYIKQAQMEERYFMPIVRYMKRMQVPADLKDAWMVKNKVNLIQDMKHQYKDFFPIIQPLFQVKPNDASYELLTRCKEAIDGYFDDTMLQLFWGLVEMSYMGKILSTDNFKKMNAWYKKVRFQMADDPVQTSAVMRTFYGFVYFDMEGIKHIAFDAQKINIIEERDEKLQKGYLVAPIIQKQYAFQRFDEILKGRSDFKKWILEVESDEYLGIVHQLKNMSGVIERSEIDHVAQQINDGEYANTALKYYSSIWNIKK